MSQRYETLFATTEAQRQAWFELRYRVFAQEQGAQVHGASSGIDTDHYDRHCHHLLVRERDSGQIVGGTRILEQRHTSATAGFYSATEFDLSALLPLPGKVIEIGRTCIDQRYRQGSTISLLWSALADYMQREQVDYLLGCASISIAEDDGLQARRIMQALRQRYPAPAFLVAKPYHPLSGDTETDGEPTPAALPCVPLRLPPLLKAYLRLGVHVAPHACIDPDFQVADAFVLLETKNLHPRYQRRFLTPTPATRAVR